MNKQLEISKYLAKVKVASLSDIYDNVPFGYYHNAEKHLGAILSRMVKAGKIERVKKGEFRWIDIAEFNENLLKKEVEVKGQGKLF